MLALENLPGRVFLDTCIVNFILDHGEQIHENVAPSAELNQRVRSDIDALRKVFLVGERAHWQLVISPNTYKEISRTSDPNRRRHLETWFNEIWQTWCDTIDESDELPFPSDAVESLPVDSSLVCLPDPPDRLLVCDAIAYRCELFCTRDWTTILKHRDSLRALPLEIVSPTEWWSRIEPYAALFL